MPPFISSKCAHCHHKNRYDCLELTETGHFARSKAVGDAKMPAQAREIIVTCRHCFKPYKIILPQGACDG